MAVEMKNASATKSIGHRGFTLLQMLIVVVVIAVIGGMAAFGIAQARQRIRLTNSARLLASYLEKARVDSVRRHPVNAADMAGVTVIDPTRYQVRLDFDGNGTVETRDIYLDSGITIVNSTVPTRFDWRGRFVTDNPATTRTSFTLQYGTGLGAPQRTVDVTRSGDVTIDSREYMDDVPNVNVNVNLSGIDSGSTVNGNYNPTPSPSPTVDPNPSPTPNPPPTPEPSPTPYPSPTAYPSPTPIPSPTLSPDPTPTPQPTTTISSSSTETPAPPNTSHCVGRQSAPSGSTAGQHRSRPHQVRWLTR